jgi:endoglucanase
VDQPIWLILGSPVGSLFLTKESLIMSQANVAGKTGLKTCSLLLSVALATLAGQLAVAGGKGESAQQLPANIDLPQEILIPQELPINNTAGTFDVDPNGGLYTYGNQIIDQKGEYCKMTGVNFSGFETHLGVPAGTWQRDYSDMIDDIVRAGFNTIRVPFSVDNMTSLSPAKPDYLCGQYGETKLNSSVRANNDLVVNWNGNALPDMKTPLECLDAFVNYAGKKGLKIILDCHSQKNDDYGNQYLWYVPNDANHSEDKWISTWIMLAEHYNNAANDPFHAVIAFDLFNEPKGNPNSTDPDVPPGCAWTVAEGTLAWNYAAQRCAVEILNTAPRMLIIVEGVQWASANADLTFGNCDYTNWGENLKGADVAPIDLGTTEFNKKVVYSFHEYPASASYICTLVGNDLPQNPLPWFPMSNNYGQCSTKDYPANLEAVWRSQWGYIAEANTRPLYAGEFGSWLNGDLYGRVDKPVPGETYFTFQYHDYADYLQTMINAMTVGGNAKTTTPQALITSDNQWMIALLDYMDSAPKTDTSKLGMSFTYFCWNPNSDDTGGLVSGMEWTLPSSTSSYSQQLQLIQPYLGRLIETNAGSSYGGGIQGERVLQMPRSSLLIAGNPLAKSTLLGGKVEFALSHLPMAGTFAWKNPSTVPTEGTSTQFVRFTPANSAFRSVLLPLQVRTVVPTVEDVDSKGDSASTFGPFYGVNLCGAEYAPNKVPGTNGTTYAFPTGEQTSYYVEKGMNIIRLPFLWERLQPQMNEPFDSSYQTLLVNSVAALRAAGTTVLIDVHNYNRRKIEAGDTSSTAGIGALASGSTTSSVPVASFSDLWTRLANLFKGDQGVVFGLMNEPTGAWDSYGHAMTSAQWVINANAAIAAIRETGAQNWITCPGNFYTGAWSWTTSTDSTGSSSSTNAVAMLNVKDSLYKTVIEVHQYFDIKSPTEQYVGTTQSCASSDGESLLSSVTAWARTNDKKLFLGEFGSGNNSTCESAVAGSTQGVLQYMQSNSDVWTGWTWWSAVADNTANDQNNDGIPDGPFSATDFSLAPVNGNDSPYMGWMAQYLSAAFTADLDRNGYVNTADLSNMLLNFGECTAPGCGDLNQDGQVDYTDVGLMLLEFHD